MEILVYKSLYKPLFWGGIPRNLFILIVFSAMLSIMTFRNIKMCLPVLAVYLIILTLVRIDPHIMTIIARNLKKKDVYLAE